MVANCQRRGNVPIKYSQPVHEGMNKFQCNTT